jgi:hypothetical protein
MSFGASSASVGKGRTDRCAQSLAIGGHHRFSSRIEPLDGAEQLRREVEAAKYEPNLRLGEETASRGRRATAWLDFIAARPS